VPLEALPYKDFTLKATVRDVPKIKSLLNSADANFIGVDDQKDTYFKVARGKLKLRQGIIENLITHYERIQEGGVEKTIVYQYDRDPRDEQIRALFLKYIVVGVVEKRREIFFIGNVKIHLDTTPDNRNFIEIEAIDYNDAMSNESLRSLCVGFKEKLEIKDEDLIKTGYLGNHD
jgi:adenylate cyclase, class 2